jgi:hypothetical protein
MCKNSSKRWKLYFNTMSQARKKVSLTEYFLFTEAWIFLAFARLSLIILPFKKIAPMLGKTKFEAGEISEGPQEKQKRIGIAILRGCHYSPWRTKCFEQAIAGKIMLKRRGIKSTVFFGVVKGSTNEIHAHSWVKSNGVIVTGGPRVDQYTIVSWFGS